MVIILASVMGDKVAESRSVSSLELLEAGRLEMPTYGMSFQIDRLLRSYLARFADARDLCRQVSQSELRPEVT
jgi:hypothetical protein